MQYINLDKLKPALEGIEDFPVDVLENIMGLVEENEFQDQSPEIEELKATIENLNTSHASELDSLKSDYESRFRNAFFKGVEPEGEAEAVEDADEEADPEDITVEELLEEILGEEKHEE